MGETLTPCFGTRLQGAIEQHPEIRTQADLARAITVSASYIGELVRKEGPPGKATLKKLSAALGVSEAWLAYGTANGKLEAASAPAVAEVRGIYSPPGAPDLARQIDEIRRGPGTMAEKDRATEVLSAAYRSSALDREAAAAQERAAAVRLEAEKAPDRTASPISEESAIRIAALVRAELRRDSANGEMPNGGLETHDRP